MEHRRQELLRQLEEAAVRTPRDPDAFLSLSYQILYGLPVELQFRAAVQMFERYLPIFEAKWPGITWPRQVLGDIGAWHREHSEGTPDEPADIDSADLKFEADFTFLLFAYRHRDYPAGLTAALCWTMLGIIHARAKNVFLADDPVANRLEKERRAWKLIEEEQRPPEPEHLSQLWQPEHFVGDHVAFLAVYRREWLHVVEWLRAEAVWQYPEPEDMDAMMEGLKRWEAREFVPMGPPGGESDDLPY